MSRRVPSSHPNRLNPTQKITVQQGIDPAYAPVVIRDVAGGFTFLTSSTMTSTDTVDLGGHAYPVVDVDISVASHPFWTGKGRALDTEGRVEKFRRRYGIDA